MSAVEIVTFGCRLNAFESDGIRRAAAEAGLADAIIVNTCAVTAEAERQARQALRRARREHPGKRIIATGCAATLAPETYAGLADVVLDNEAKLQVESYLEVRPPVSLHSRESGNPGPPLRRLPLDPRQRGGDEKKEGHLPIRARTYLQVQQGCDHRCTFCIIPYARGPSRSVPIGAIVAEARRMVERGCREIVLTGVDLTAYGADLPGRPTLGQMARRLLAAVPDLPRLRLSSLDPSEIDEDLWRLFAGEQRLMPHLHLSLQAGDNLILKRMKRRHSRGDAIAVAKRARELRPETAIGADLIAGFPTETEEMFRQSLDIVEECGIAFLHVFPYSKRPGTPAARMPEIAPEVVRERAARLRAAGATQLEKELSSRVGHIDNILVEKENVGRAGFYAAVALDRAAVPGTVRWVRFVGAEDGKLIGVAA
jgi:threonylcarbamoyladenosine tRNA methylthiotransferase MtaB